ncbi:hypothetical protein A2Y99_01230 [Candidatus Gottesmanbacteria bacterium RBG_13_37_7]|uniref:Short-chain dehydrogenase n=1 Tax=Candidatus Gottesmanbacteria bacterium RBG_13_37_7 TaxID=1798369 RepID=A0A1F5YHN7_9BACT|nr:MAG: hypothetical protein A2Y99_01230 [Candidatus Gottesmanbacteria bacterium RBG_13_37_7]
MDLFQLESKIAVVTGGLGNLGPWLVISLVEAGAKVVVLDLPKVNVPVILHKNPRIRNKIKFYYSDITDILSLHIVHSQIIKDLGKVQILVNNAGIDAPPVITNDSDDKEKRNAKFNKMWAVNVQGMVNCIEEFSSDMTNTGGSIINIGSLYMERSPYEYLYTHLGFDKPWAYGATKAAVGQVTKHFSTRLAKCNIRVNTLSPGGILGDQDKEFVRKFSARVPLGRMAKKETDLGGPLVFLASNASRYITGINLQVNGGYTAW